MVLVDPRAGSYIVLVLPKGFVQGICAEKPRQAKVKLDRHVGQPRGGTRVRAASPEGL